MHEPIWFEVEEVLAIHEMQLAGHGGSEGVRDFGLLQSALARPKNLFVYATGELTLPQMAASYAFGIARNHAFVDGYKRTALVVALAFLEVNGIVIQSAQEEIYLTFLHLVEGNLSEKELAEWLEAHAAHSA